MPLPELKEFKLKGLSRKKFDVHPHSNSARRQRRLLSVAPSMTVFCIDMHNVYYHKVWLIRITLPYTKSHNKTIFHTQYHTRHKIASLDKTSIVVNVVVLGYYYMACYNVFLACLHFCYETTRKYLIIRYNIQILISKAKIFLLRLAKCEDMSIASDS